MSWAVITTNTVLIHVESQSTGDCDDNCELTDDGDEYKNNNR